MASLWLLTGYGRTSVSHILAQGVASRYSQDETLTLVSQGVQSFGQSRSTQQIYCMIGVITFVHLEADDLAAVYIEDQVQAVMPHAA